MRENGDGDHVRADPLSALVIRTWRTPPPVTMLTSAWPRHEHQRHRGRGRQPRDQAGRRHQLPARRRHGLVEDPEHSLAPA
ncbi:MAG TPA: hypothetical protein VGL02_07275, partial [Streptomyces sp.]